MVELLQSKKFEYDAFVEIAHKVRAIEGIRGVRSSIVSIH